ncbi:MAG: hypothetical protein ACOWWM_09175 [Desulfobacterales bacterium]
MTFKALSRCLTVLLVTGTLYFPAAVPVAKGASPIHTVSADPPPGTLCDGGGRQGLPAGIEEICLYEIIDGKQRKKSIWPDDLSYGNTIDSEGYVCGIELVSNSPGFSASLEDRALEWLDGNDGIPGGAAGGAGGKGGPSMEGLHRFGFFPKVAGDAVSTNDRFSVSIESEGRNYDLSIRQKGYRTLPSEDAGRSVQGDEPRFRFLGPDMPAFASELQDFDERIAALAAGVAFVEKAVGGKLVGYINIIDFDGPDNALTTLGQDQVWIYADTFRNQRISELRSMAEHEALHILTDLHGYTRKAELRGFFSDLHGFEPLSMERFSIVARGSLRPEKMTPGGTASPLFAFINERNFIPGMTGGHSGDNLDEFCTSFLHAILYIDRLPINIDQSHLVTRDGSLLPMSARLREVILRDFRRGIDILMDSTPDYGQHGSVRTSSTRISALFEQSAKMAARLDISE